MIVTGAPLLLFSLRVYAATFTMTACFNRKKTVPLEDCYPMTNKFLKQIFSEMSIDYVFKSSGT